MPKSTPSSSKGRDRMSSSRSSASSSRAPPSASAPPSARWISSPSETASTRGTSLSSHHTPSAPHHDTKSNDGSSSSSPRELTYDDRWEHVMRYLSQLGQISQLTLGPRIHFGSENPDLPRLRTAADSTNKGLPIPPRTHYTPDVYWARAFFMDEDGPRPKTVVCSMYDTAVDGAEMALYKELFLMATSSLLLSFQNNQVPLILAVQRIEPARFIIITEPFCDNGWSCASRKSPRQIKERIFDTYAELHRNGILHGSPSLLNIAVPSTPEENGDIHIYDFSRARCIDVAARTRNGSRLPVIDNIPTYSEMESDWEMRHVCFLMDYNHSRTAELSKFVMDFSSLAAAAEQRRRDMENGAKIGMSYGFGGIRQRSPLYDEYRDPDSGEYRVVDKRLEWQWTKTEAYQIEQKMIATYVQAVKRGDKHMVKTADRSLRDMRIHLKGRMRPDGLDRLRIPISEEFVKEGEHPWFQWPTTLTPRDLDIDESALTVEALNVPTDFARRLKLLTRDSQQYDTSAGRSRQMNMDDDSPSLPKASAEQDSKTTISAPTEESSMEGINSDPELGDFDVKKGGSNFFDDDEELIELKPEVESRERTPMPSAQAYAAILPITNDSTVNPSHTAHPSSSACEESLDEKKARLKTLGREVMEAAQDVQRVAAITKQAEGTADPEELVALLGEVQEMVDKDGSSSDEVDDLLAGSMELASSSATATDESSDSSPSPIAVSPPARSAQFASSASAFGLGSSRSTAPSSRKRKDPPTSPDDIEARPSRRARRPNAFDTPEDTTTKPSIDASASNTSPVSETPATQSTLTSEPSTSASSLSEHDLAKFQEEVERDPELKAKFEAFLRREESTGSDMGGTTAVPSRASTPLTDSSGLKAWKAIKAMPRTVTACTTQAPYWDEQKDGLAVGFLPTSKPDCIVYSYKHYDTADNPYSRHSPRWRLEEPQKPVDAKGTVYYPEKELGSTCWLAKIDAVGRTDVEGFQLRQGEPVHKVFDTLLRGAASTSSPEAIEAPLTGPSPTLVNLPLDQVHATAWDDQFPRIPPLNEDGTTMPLRGAKFSFDLDEYEGPEFECPKDAAYRREMRRRHGLILNRRVVKYMLWLAAKQDTRNAAFYKRIPSTPLARMLAGSTPPVLPHSSKDWHLSRDMIKRTAKFFKDTVRQEQQKERAHQRLVRQLRKGKAPENGSPARDNARDSLPNKPPHSPLSTPLSSMRFVTQPVSSSTNSFSKPLPTSAARPPSTGSVFGTSFGAPLRSKATLPSHSWSPSENFLRDAFPAPAPQQDTAARPPTPDPFAQKPIFGTPTSAPNSTFGATPYKPWGFGGSPPFVKPFGAALSPPSPYAAFPTPASGSNVFGAAPAPPKHVPSSTFGPSPWGLSRPALPSRHRQPFHSAKFYANGSAVFRADDIGEAVEEIEVEYLVRDAFDTEDDVPTPANGAAQEVGQINSSLMKRNWEAAVNAQAVRFGL